MRERQSRSVKLVLLGVVTTLVWGLFEFSPAREYVDTVKSGTPVQTSSLTGTDPRNNFRMRNCGKKSNGRHKS